MMTRFGRTLGWPERILHYNALAAAVSLSTERLYGSSPSFPTSLSIPTQVRSRPTAITSRCATALRLPVKPEVDRVRAELARLVDEPR